MPPADVAVMPPPPPLPEGPVQRRPMSPPRPTRPPVDASNCLWVGNLACDVSDDILRAYFEEFGMLDDVHVVRDPHTRRSKGFAFVSYETCEHADRALRFVTESQLAILNRQVRIKRSAPRPPRNGPGAASGRGGFGGRGGRGGGRGGGPGGMRGGRGGGSFRGGPPRPFGDRRPDQQRNYPNDRHGGSHRSGYDDRRSDRDYPNDRHSGSHRSGYDDTRHHGDRKRHASYDDRDRDRGHSRDYSHDSRRQDEHRRHHSYDDRGRGRRSSYDGGSGSGRDYRDRDRERSPRRDYR